MRCQLDATLVRWVIAFFVVFLSCRSLKIAFGHLSLKGPGFLSVLSIGCYACLLDATLVCCMLVLSFFEGFLNDTGVLVCVVNWMLLLSVGCYPCVLHARVVVI